MIQLIPMVPGEESIAIAFVQKYYAEDELLFDVKVQAAVADLIAHPEWGSIYRIRHLNQTIGYMGLTFGYDHEIGGRFGTITDFYIEPEFRCQGIGADALNQLINHAISLDLKEIGLVVLDHNERVRPLYQKLGFRPETGRGWMWRRLDQQE